MSFDSKDFDRSKIIKEADPVDPSKMIEKNKGFYSPLGVGVLFKNADSFRNAFFDQFSMLSINFKISLPVPFCSSYYLKKMIGLGKAISFYDQLVTNLQDYIDLVHVSYVVLPPAEFPKVRVGGTNYPEIEINTFDFLRNLSPMFSYITAWNFLHRHRNVQSELFIDGFRSKRTIAWDELISYCQPKVFPRGDECNPFICMADIMAFLTDAKLYSADFEHRRLTPENVELAWEDYKFKLDCRFLDEKNYSKYKWYNDNLIDIRPYLAHPIIFLLIDEIEKIGPSVVQTSMPSLLEKPKKFREVVQRMPPYYAAILYAQQKGGSVQFFDRYLDSDKIMDGDVLVYMGDVSKKIATTFKDAFEVEVFSFRELRKKVGV
jgi:hypothetical protein